MTTDDVVDDAYLAVGTAKVEVGNALEDLRDTEDAKWDAMYSASVHLEQASDLIRQTLPDHPLPDIAKEIWELYDGIIVLMCRADRLLEALPGGAHGSPEQERWKEILSACDAMGEAKATLHQIIDTSRHGD